MSNSIAPPANVQMAVMTQQQQQYYQQQQQQQYYYQQQQQQYYYQQQQQQYYQQQMYYPQQQQQQQQQQTVMVPYQARNPSQQPAGSTSANPFGDPFAGLTQTQSIPHQVNPSLL
ncbi:putative clathrin assembly protein [Iris pallida]|uniref:Clathrin assembly protein n=1 Tax=Iris pallida TaxID=29817 RepID=A0AAX6I2J0_IRIPA|nr:putative clathrin assembly protein [Iris pallida]